MGSSVAPTASAAVAALLLVLTVSGLQVFKTTLGSSEALTLVGGAASSLVTLFSLTALSNLEEIVLGEGTQTGWVEVIIALLSGLSVAGSIHRVSVTVCLICSALLIHGVNNISAKTYYGSVAPVRSSKKNK